nr:putative GH32 family protein [Didymodactylos carnosus]WEI57592.1 putative GH32 family protein [Didymodactylos carnosus]
MILLLLFVNLFPNVLVQSAKNSTTISTIPTGASLAQTNLNTLPNNILFNQWRSQYHFLAPNSWMNDPCGPVYHSPSQTYHLFYQWNPQHIKWGNISWGHATSKDLIKWTDVPLSNNNYMTPGISTEANSTYDNLGIFTGTAQTLSNGSILIIYTSVRHLPISWALPYINNSESQSLILSNDNGTTWQRYANNPVIATPPPNVNITGFRDPFLQKWREMDTLLNNSNNWYVTVSSGTKTKGTNLFLYTASDNTIQNLTYLGNLISLTENFTFNENWSGTWGFNLEVATVFSLNETVADGGEEGVMRTYVTAGSEGGNTTLHTSAHWSVWAEGLVINDKNASAYMTLKSGGVADWGATYAMLSFLDSQERRVFFGWVPDDFNDYALTQIGYNGQFILPRQAFIQVTPDITPGSLPSSLLTSGPFTVQAQPNGLWRVHTLGFRVLPEFTTWFNSLSSVVTFLNNQMVTNSSTHLLSNFLTSNRYELNVTVMNYTTTFPTITIYLATDPQYQEYTMLTYNFMTYDLTIIRTHSSLITQFDSSTVYAKHFLFSNKESLQLRIFLDNSLLEVHANERTSLATHIYPVLNTSTQVGYAVSNGAGVQVTVIGRDLSKANVWPQRPINTSVPLVYDTAAETNNYTYWTGN